MRAKGDVGLVVFLVVAAGLMAALVGVVALVLPVSAPRNSVDEAPLHYDCGTPAGFIAGRSSPELRPVAGPSDDVSKVEACRSAMAPRLAVTTWAFGVGLAVMVLLGAALFAASLWSPRGRATATVGVVAMVAVGSLGLPRTHPTRRVAACDVLSARDVERVLGAPAPAPSAFEPIGDVGHATGCSYGTAPGVHLTVFAIAPGGQAFERRQHAALVAREVEERDVSGAGYRASVTGGPQERSESAVVVQGDRYVNVVVYEAAPGSAERLVPIAARGLVEW